MSDGQQEVEVITETVIETPVEQPTHKDKRPLTHRLSRAQLEDIGRNMTVPRVIQAQFTAKTGDKKHEGKAQRRPHQPRGNVMDQNAQTQTPGSVPQSNGTPTDSKVDNTVRAIAGVPYSKAAATGAVFGAAMAAGGSLVFFGGKWVIGKIKGSGSPDSI